MLLRPIDIFAQIPRNQCNGFYHEKGQNFLILFAPTSIRYGKVKWLAQMSLPFELIINFTNVKLMITDHFKQSWANFP